MSGFYQSVMRFATGRVARNIYFWLLLIYTRLEFNYTPLKVLFTAILFALLMLLFYGNNLFLLPQLLSRKKYKAYWLSYSVLTFIVSLAYTWAIKWMIHHYPEIDTGMVSPLAMETETGLLTAGALLKESVSYFIILFIAGCIFAMSWYVMKYQRLEKEVEAIEKKHLQTELDFLKSQVNPHFLFNTLNNLYTLTLTKSDAAPDVVSKLAAILRYLLYESNEASVSFDKEKEIMQAYIDLELLRLSDKKHLHFDITADRSCKVPPLLWVPVLENVFKHGTRFISSEYFIDYSFRVKGEEIQIYSKNRFKHQPFPW